MVYILEFDHGKTGYLEESVIQKKLTSIGDDRLSAGEITHLLSLAKSKENGKINYKG